MPRSFLLFYALLLAPLLSGQEVFVIKVVDSRYDPLFGAHIRIYSDTNASAVVLGGGTTDFKGSWIIPSALSLRPGCFAQVRYMGMQTRWVELSSQKAPAQVVLYPSAFAAPEYVVSALSGPTRIRESVYQARAIGQERIEGQGAQNLKDVLSNDLNIRIGQDAVLGSGISMQGLGGENVQIMIDGVPVIGRLDGNVDLSQLPLQNVEKIEIIEGPMSVQFGSSAIGGVINLISKKEQTHPITGGFTLYGESVGQYNADARLSIQRGKHRFAINGGRYFFDGFNPTDTVSRWQAWKPREQYFGNAMYGVALKRLYLSSNSQMFFETLQFKGQPEAPFYIAANDQYFYTRRLDQTVQLTGFVGKSWHINLTAAFNNYERQRQSFRKDLVSLQEIPIDSNLDVFNRAMSRGVFHWTPQGDSTRFKWQMGYDAAWDYGEGPRISEGHQSFGEVSGFSSLEYRPGKNWAFTPGIRYGYHSAFAMRPIPSFHAMWKNSHGFRVRASYAQGFRAPSLKELYFEFVDVNHNLLGNPDLLPEQSHQVQWGIQWQRSWVALSESKPRKWTRLPESAEGICPSKKTQLRFSLNGFYNQVNNQIRQVLQTNTSGMVYRSENISSVNTLGGRVEGGMQWNRFVLDVGFSLTGIQQALEIDYQVQQPYVWAQEYRAQAMVVFHEWQGRFQVFAKYNGTQPYLYADVDPISGEPAVRQGELDGFASVDVSYTQRLLKNKLRITLLGKNLFDVTNVLQSGGGGGTAHSQGSGSLPTLWGRTFGFSCAYQFSAGNER